MSSNRINIHNIAKSILSWFTHTNSDSTCDINPNSGTPILASQQKKDIPSFNRYIDIPIPKKGTIEIPILGGNRIYKSIAKNPSLEHIILPLFERYEPVESNVSNTILRDIGELGLWISIRKYILKSSVLYGALGMIFDENFNLLVYSTKEFDINKHEDEPLSFKRDILHISPELFRGTNIVSKAIINNGIVGILDYNLAINNDRYKVHINMTDLSNIVKETNKPTVFDNLDEELLQIVVDNFRSTIGV